MKQIKNKIIFKKKIFIFIFSLLLSIIFFLSISNYSYCSTPKIVKTLEKAFSEIKSWLLMLSTPAAAIAVGTGVFMKKFSFGDEERLRTGKKLIKNSLFSYAFILGIDLILSAIESLIG